MSDDISSGSIILLDMMEADKKLIHYWQDTLSRKNNNIKILLLNTPEDYPYRDIENWPHINGVFYSMEDQERVVNGLQGVLRGECYFTQKLASYGNDSNLLIVFYVQIMPDDFVMQLHRF
ncbi:csgab operon transcriptional regulator [Escherichia coli]|nr:csgab operon transcriptional regulator [Escherichia coli]